MNMKINKIKSQFISFNKAALILKCDKYDLKNSAEHGKLKEEMKLYRAGDEKWNGTFL